MTVTFIAAKNSPSMVIGERYSAILVPGRRERGEAYVGALALGPAYGCHLLLEYEAKSLLSPGEKTEIHAYLVLDDRNVENYAYLARLY